MEDYGNNLDVASPSNSLYYVYGDAEQYSSGSQSPCNSTYEIASTADLSSFTSVYPSPEQYEEPSQATEGQKPATKRKRENRYKNAPPSVLSRRRAQNRASQRAYRERKDQRIKDLEQMLNDANQRNDVLNQAYRVLQSEYVALKTAQLKEHGYHQQPDLPYTTAHGLGITTGTEGLDIDLYVYPDLSPSYPM
ncbi:AP-1-like transcription factor YAP1 [Podospora fimiseda]|uniref:Putative transcription factor kapC n=1 Tax=Podospora fimiseda TaxID=252190 RepID=A0AAN7H1N2_9PEZI|nr:AP-1-like transcription factor YAP1 [Podospora fimiseda]